jgi:23S rRNA pseudouridine2605 synthase/23S rRNA pseudouridine2604 synthase
MIRLNKFIANSGFVSRRTADQMILGGLVFVNGKRVTTMGVSINPETDAVEVNGTKIRVVTEKTYIALNKPVGVISTRATYQNEKTVYDLVPKSRNLVIAGRLDKDSDGLVLLTNDGELVNKLTHPSFGHQKEYEIVTTREFSEEDRKQLMDGIPLEEGKAVFDSLLTVGPNRYRIVLRQGWKRQIRRMTAAVHAHLKRLTRVRINKLTLEGLKPGEWREVKRSDIV